MFTEDPVIGGILYKEKGVIEVSDAPGLGAAIDQSYLDKAEKVVI
jgi:L-alanine-DL-glutamate epimerase-like enolase superfamily enzyme